LSHSPQIQRVALISVHTCPLAMLGGKKTGGMNVYVRDFSRELGRQGVLVDVFTRSQDDCVPMVMHDLGYGGRVIHIPAGPEKPIPLAEVGDYLDEFAAGTLAFAAREGIRYDLIHSHYWLSGLVAEKLRDAWGAPSSTCSTPSAR
jgi:D-inositol-3-phosphate glycosyltransferase